MTHWRTLCFLSLKLVSAELEILVLKRDTLFSGDTARGPLNYKLCQLPGLWASCNQGPAIKEESSPCWGNWPWSSGGRKTVVILWGQERRCVAPLGQLVVLSCSVVMINGQVQQPFWNGHGDSTRRGIRVTTWGKPPRPAEVRGNLGRMVEEQKDVYQLWSWGQLSNRGCNSCF